MTKIIVILNNKICCKDKCGPKKTINKLLQKWMPCDSVSFGDYSKQQINTSWSWKQDLTYCQSFDCVESELSRLILKMKQMKIDEIRSKSKNRQRWFGIMFISCPSPYTTMCGFTN